MNELARIKNIIKYVHAAYYANDVLENPKQFLTLHEYLQELFNFAGIESTLVSKNPGELSPEQVRHAIKQGWLKEKPR